MISSTKLHERFATEELTPGTRIIAMAFALINIPLAIMGLLHPIGWVIGAPGYVLFINYFRIWFDKVSSNTAKTVWISTALYNLALIIGFGITTEFRGWPIMLGQAFAIGLSLIAYRGLTEKDEEEIATLNNIPTE